MLETFTFVTLSYNQQDYIIEHLESIKQVIKHYGDKIRIDYILADDCSSDKTVEKVRNWLTINKGLFNDIIILNRSKNTGVVRNMLDAVKHVKTEHYKLLAGDDKFMCKDVFSLYDNLENKLIITPVIPFGDVSNKKVKDIKKSFCLICLLKTTSKVSKMIKCENFLPAPGIFISGSWLRESDFQKFLLQFRDIEDYPMFYYLLNIKKCEIKILYTSYIEYRIGSGVSTSKDNNKKKKFKIGRASCRERV